MTEKTRAALAEVRKRLNALEEWQQGQLNHVREGISEVAAQIKRDERQAGEAVPWVDDNKTRCPHT